MASTELYKPDPETALRRQALRQSFAVLVLGLALSLWVAHTLQKALQAEAWSRFQYLANNGHENVEKRFLVPSFGLQALRSALLARSAFSRQDFREAVLERHLLEAFPGLSGIAFVERVPRSELALFLKRVQADQAPDFHIKTQGEAPDLYIVKYIEPLAPHQASLGLDLGSEPAQRAVLEQAVRSGQATLSARMRLRQGQSRHDGFLLVLPLFRQEPQSGDTLDRRLQLLEGWLFVPLRIDEVMRDFQQVSGDLLALQLFDGGEPRDEHLLFESAGTPRGGGLGEVEPLFSQVWPLQVGGHELNLRLSSSPSFESSFQRQTPLYVALGGILLFGLLALLIWQQSQKRFQALSLARSMTAELRRKAQVADLSQNAISLRDLRGQIQWVNTGFLQLSGYDEDEVLGHTLPELLERSGATPEDTRDLERAMRQGQTCRVDMCQRSKDGRLIWVSCELQPVRDDHGVLTGYLEISQDITAQRAARESLQVALQETDVLNRTIRQHALVIRTDSQGQIIEVNDAFCRQSGYRRDELLGQNPRMISSGVHPGSHWAKLWQMLMAGESWHGQICNRSKNGSYYWLDSLIAPFRGTQGDVASFISISFDISESKRTERTLARERRTLSNILEGTHAGTWAWNMTNGAIDINAQFALMLGYQPQELMPFNFVRWRTLIHQDDLAELDAVLQAHQEDATPWMEVTVRLHHKAGHVVWGMLRGKINARNEGGEARWMSGTQIDITAQRQDEEALREAHERFTLAKDSAGIGMWDYEASTQLLKWDARMFALHDMPESDAPIDVAQWRQAICPDDEERVAHAFAQALREHTSFDVEFKTCWRQNDMRHLHMCAQVLRDDSGQPLRMVGVALDLSPSQRRETHARGRQAHPVQAAPEGATLPAQNPSASESSPPPPA